MKTGTKARIASVILAGLLAASLAACAGGVAEETNPPATANTDTEAPTTVVTEVPTEEPTQAVTEPLETEPILDPVVLDPSGWTVHPENEKVIYISSEAGLRKLSSESAAVDKTWDGVTFNIMSDINLEGEDWVPINGTALADVVINGNNHTISGMLVNGKPFTEGANMGETFQLGFIGMTNGFVEIKDLTFDQCEVNAQGKHVGIIVGENSGGMLNFNNVKVTNSAVNGFLKYQDEGGSSLISFRVGGFVGAQIVPGSYCDIRNCAVDGLKLSGFHNLAAFIGYDGVDGTILEDSSAKNVEMTFSYTYSDNYEVDHIKVGDQEGNYKFVAVFYNILFWYDHLDEDLADGNTYENVKFIDYVGGGVYDATDFRGETQ